MKIPMWMARFIAIFSPTFYRLTHWKPRFTPYALATILSNSRISHAKAQRELGYTPRSIKETIYDTVQWLREASLRRRTAGNLV